MRCYAFLFKKASRTDKGLSIVRRELVRYRLGRLHCYLYSSPDMPGKANVKLVSLVHRFADR